MKTILVSFFLVAAGYTYDLRAGELKKPRVWTDVTGTYRITASLERIDIVLRHEDGATRTIPVEKLSLADRRMLASIIHPEQRSKDAALREGDQRSQARSDGVNSIDRRSAVQGKQVGKESRMQELLMRAGELSPEEFEEGVRLADELHGPSTIKLHGRRWRGELEVAGFTVMEVNLVQRVDNQVKVDFKVRNDRGHDIGRWVGSTLLSIDLIDKNGMRRSVRDDGTREFGGTLGISDLPSNALKTFPVFLSVPSDGYYEFDVYPSQGSG